MKNGYVTPMHKRKALRAILHAIPGNAATAQRVRILTALQTLGTCTTPEMVRWLDCPRAGSRICELRAEGAPIVTHWRHDTTEAGEPHRFALYAMAPSPAD